MALAQYEIALNDGCSVYYHDTWRFFEFNLLRASGYKVIKGLTTWGLVHRLFSPPAIQLEMEVSEDMKDNSDGEQKT